jgi:Tol biopolymer transport system component/predicted Ser/Thr protein kinase
VTRESVVGSGLRIGRYVLEAPIGTGGMGDVWRALDEDLDRRVAIKILARDLGNESARRRFAREARILARLQHPNVVSVHDVGQMTIDAVGEVPFLVMECIDGRPLNELVVDQNLRPAQALRLMHQVALALGAAHAEGVVHRDLKPSNVMVTADQMVKVLDFGLARAFETRDRRPEETLTAPGAVVGSCAYMAPEQALGESVTPASDVFAFGAVLYELLSGRRAFPGSNSMGVLRAVARAEVAPLKEVAPDLPPGAMDLVGRCLQRRPEDRFEDGGRLASAMERFDDDERTVELAASFAAPSRAGRRQGWRRWIVAVAVVAAVALGGLAVRLAPNGHERPGPRPGDWQVTEVLNRSGSIRNPTWMPDGTGLLAAIRDGARSEIVGMGAAGGGLRVLRRGAEGEALARPAVSPDGRQLAVMVVGLDPPLRVEVSDLGSSVASTVIEGAINPRWTGDGRLEFSRTREGRTERWVRGLTDGSESLLDPDGRHGSVWDALPMPGGGPLRALVVGSTDVRAGVTVVDDGGPEGESWLDEGRVFDGASWAPGAETLAVVVDGRLSRISGRDVEPLLPRLENLSQPAFSPNGASLAVVQQWTRWDLVGVDPEDGAQRCVLCGENGAGWGSVGPFGRLVYRREVAGGAQIVLRTTDGGRRVVTDPSERPTCPVLSPDGGRLAYLNVSEERGLELRVRTLDGSPPVVLAHDLEPSEFPSWSPTGDEIAFAGGAPLRVHIASLSGEPVRTLPVEGADYPVWHPTGDRLAFSIWTDDDDPNQGLWVASGGGDAPIQVSSLPTRAAWSADGSTLWQLRPADGGVELWAAPVGGWSWRREQTVGFGRDATPHDAFRPFTVDPVSGDLVFGLRKTESSLIVFSGVNPDRW